MSRMTLVFIINKSGTGVIFPGWFEHQVPPHTGDKERIIVVGNVEGSGCVDYPQKQRKFTIVQNRKITLDRGSFFI